MRPHRGTKVNGSHHGDSPLLKPTGIKIATKPLPGPTDGEHRNLSVSRRCFGYELQFLLSGVLPIFQNLNYKPKRRLPDLLPNQQRPQKLYNCFSSSRRVTRRQVMRHFTGHGTDQCRNGLSNILIPYREQPRPTRTVVAYPRSASKASNMTNYAPIRFDHNPILFKTTHHKYIRKFEIPWFMVMESLSC